MPTVISRALPLRTLEQLCRAALIVWVAAGHRIAAAIGLALAVQLTVSLIAALVGPNHDSPWLLPASLDEPIAAPIDRVDAVAIPDRFPE